MRPIKLSLRNERPFRLIPNVKGRHQFGGQANYKGTVPEGTDTPLQLMLLLNLDDPLVPVDRSREISRLPLYYPFKFGYGGPAVQYAVHSDTKIEILHMSSTTPDDPCDQYLQVDELPKMSLDLVPLTYEQARILAFQLGDSHFRPNREDRAILDDLDMRNLIRVGGQRDYIANSGDIICRNRHCECYKERVYFRMLAMLPPISVAGDDEFWHEFQGGDLLFCFGFCHYCGTVIAFNVAD